MSRPTGSTPKASWQRTKRCSTRTGALTQIIDENKPEGPHLVVPDVAARIDAIVSEIAFTGWRESTPDDRAVKKELRAALKTYGLPISGDLVDKAYAYVRENY